jgi:hypothetical protein
MIAFKFFWPAVYRSTANMWAYNDKHLTNEPGARPKLKLKPGARSPSGVDADRQVLVALHLALNTQRSASEHELSCRDAAAHRAQQQHCNFQKLQYEYICGIFFSDLICHFCI